MQEKTKAIIVNFIFIFGCGTAIYWFAASVLEMSFAGSLWSSTIFGFVSTYMIFGETMNQRKLQQSYIYAKPLEGQPKGIFARAKEANKLYPMYAEVKMIPIKAYVIAAVAIVGMMTYGYIAK